MLKNKRVLVYTVSNNDYFHFLEALIFSILENCKECSMFISLVNVPSYKVEWIKSIDLDITVDDLYIDFPSKEIEKGFCTNRRVNLLSNSHSMKYDWVFYVDANVLVNKNLNKFLASIESRDSAIMIDSNHITSNMSKTQLKKYPKGPLGTPYYGVCAAGIQGYRVSDIVRQFLTEYKELTSPKLYSWYADQEALYLMYEKYKQKINFYHMDAMDASSDNPLSLFIYKKGGSDDSVYQERMSSFIQTGIPCANIKLDKNILHNHRNDVQNKVTLLRFLKRKICKQQGEYYMLNKLKPKELIYRIDWYANKYLFNNRLIKRRLKEVTMFLDTQTDGISRTLSIKRVREEDMVFLMKKYIKPGQVVIDCGSNIGFYPLLESKLVGDKGHIVCIEPDYRNYELLQKNISLIDNVKTSLFNMAISDKKGVMTLDIGGPSNLNKIVASEASVNSETVDVEVDTIDNLVNRLNLKPDFIRMDIEGHEVEVISGMRETIKSAPPGFVIFFELHPDEYSETHSLERQLEFLYSEGFICEAIVSAGEPNPSIYKKLGYAPDFVMKTDSLERGLYYNVDQDDAINLATSIPKSSRYILLSKKKG